MIHKFPKRTYEYLGYTDTALADRITARCPTCSPANTEGYAGDEISVTSAIGDITVIIHGIEFVDATHYVVSYENVNRTVMEIHEINSDYTTTMLSRAIFSRFPSVGPSTTQSWGFFNLFGLDTASPVATLLTDGLGGSVSYQALLAVFTIDPVNWTITAPTSYLTLSAVSSVYQQLYSGRMVRPSYGDSSILIMRNNTGTSPAYQDRIRAIKYDWNGSTLVPTQTSEIQLAPAILSTYGDISNVGPHPVRNASDDGFVGMLMQSAASPRYMSATGFTVDDDGILSLGSSPTVLDATASSGPYVTIRQWGALDNSGTPHFGVGYSSTGLTYNIQVCLSSVDPSNVVSAPVCIPATADGAASGYTLLYDKGSQYYRLQSGGRRRTIALRAVELFYPPVTTAQKFFLDKYSNVGTLMSSGVFSDRTGDIYSTDSGAFDVFGATGFSGFNFPQNNPYYSDLVPYAVAYPVGGYLRTGTIRLLP